MSSKTHFSKISVFALTMLIVGSIDSIRNLPAAALFGTSLPFFFVLATLFFLIPTALTSAELSATWPEDGGIYNWVRLAFGEKWGFLAIWLQWVNTVVWFPTILSFIAGIIAYMIYPALAKNKYFLVSVILVVFWGITLINLKGLNTSTKLASFCAVVGMIIPMVFIILLGFYWVSTGEPKAITFAMSDMIPDLSHLDNWVSLTAIITSFLGMELATVHVKDIHNPQKKFPKALFFSVLIIMVTMLCGALSIAFVVPLKEINLVEGVMQTFSGFFSAYHCMWLLPILAVMLFLGSFGGLTNWVISPAKGLLHAAEYDFLPPILQRLNRHHVPSRILLMQAILVSLICVVFILMPSVNGAYWLLTDLSTELYVVMYLLMFFASMRLRIKYPNKFRPFCIKGGVVGHTVMTCIGLFGSVVAICVGFIPPAGIDVGGQYHFTIMFTTGMFMMIIPVFIFYAYERHARKHHNISTTQA